MKKLPLGIQSFKKIVDGNYLYVDKTKYIYDLLNSASYYFLSRPRRFGKSLLLDTIGEVFNGSKELFNGLWIYDSDYEFKKHPVIRFDMSNIANETPDIFKSSLLYDLRIKIDDEELNITNDYPANIFKRLIMELYKKYGQTVVVLVDEYDKPILDHIDVIEIAEANRQVLRNFYGILKSMDPYLRFTFITGVSKFSKTSIFSGLNNLSDITLTNKYANICGVETDDLNEYFKDYIDNLSAHENFKHYENLHCEILNWYDGYSWDGKTKVINPYSLLNFIDQERFAGYWYASGTPGFLLDMIKKNPESYTSQLNFVITEDMLDSADIGKISFEPLLFQTGYLTIKDIPLTIGTPVYNLDIPNFEVREAFNLHVLSALSEHNDVRTGQMRMAVNGALETGDLQKMLEILRGFFASIPYNLHVDLEAYYHSIFYALMSALGFDMSVEVSASKGKIDAVLDLDDKVYVMEFKYCKYPPDASAEKKRELFDKTLNEAMEQIIFRGYSDKYIGSGKTIYQAAFAFLGRDDIALRTR